MTDFLEQKLKEIQDRLDELKPSVDEYNQLLAAAETLDGVDDGGGEDRASRPRRGPGRRRSAKAATAKPGAGPAAKAVAKQTTKRATRPAAKGAAKPAAKPKAAHHLGRRRG